MKPNIENSELLTAKALESIKKISDKLPDDINPVNVKGYDFEEGIDYNKIFESYATSGFQATNLSLAIDEINKMLDCKAREIQLTASTEHLEHLNLNEFGRDNKNCTIFLAFTSNMISSGLRETIRFLCKHNLVDVIVTSAGGVEEDLIKCLSPTLIGEFDRWSGDHLRQLSINRIGNLLVPNNNYCMFEQWLNPCLKEMLDEQVMHGYRWTASKLIRFLGKKIDNPDSIYYWCYKNNIPVFCPAITDGSLGDMLFVNSYKYPELVIDVIEDIRLLNSQALQARHSGAIILGGGMAKHHTLNANLMRNGADFCVFINTGSEFDGSDSGARPDEAKSWGKIRPGSRPVKVCCDATLVFPIVVARTFAART